MNDWFEAEQRIERAQELSASQQWEEALREIDAALQINSESASGHAHRGYLLEELDRTEDALEAYRRSLELQPGDRDVMVAWGLGFCRLGRFNRALETFDELARLYPDCEPAYCHRIAIYSQLGRHDQAEQMFYLAQELNPDCPDCFNHVGESLAVRNKMDRALYCWERVLELDPEYPGVRERMAEACRVQGRIDDAREYLLTELREDRGNNTCELLYKLAELALQSDQTSQATAKFAQIIELDPSHVDAHFALGRIFLGKDQADRAVKCLEEIASSEVKETLDGFETALGEAYLRTGRLDKSRATLEVAAHRDPKDAEALLLLGECLLAMDKPAEAADRCRAALALDVRHVAAQQVLGMCLLSSKSHEAALDHFMMALAHRSHYMPAVRGAVIANLRLGRFGEARRLLNRSLKHSPDDPGMRLIAKRFWRYRFNYLIDKLRARFGKILGR